MDRNELIEHYNFLVNQLDVELENAGKVNLRLYIYECVHLINSISVPKQHFKDALQLVDIQDKHKFRIIADTLKLLISQSNCINEIRRYTINAIEFLKQLQDRVYNESYFDTLTGVFNFNYLQKIESEISPKPFSLFFFDLDDLKKKNDKLGHEHGNKMIRSFAQVLKSSFRFNDIVVRYGGDEFVVIVLRNNINHRAAIKKITQHPLINQLDIAFSFGFAHNSHKSLKRTLAAADRLMYVQKEQK